MSGNRFTLRTIILVALCLQNGGYTLLRKYSMMTENVSSKEILLVGEIIKLFVSTWFIQTDHEISDAQGNGAAKLIWLIKNSYKMFVLAAIYGAMNILSFVALQYIGAGEFTVCAQLKILTTAGFSVAILGTSLSHTKWRALILLVLGCILVASPSFSGHGSSSATEKEKRASAYLQLLGYGSVLLEVALSGFASIYFEKVVKSTTEKVTIWERNFQLSLYSIIVYSSIILYEGNVTRQPWSNWTIVTILVAVLGAAGGLLVAATLKYADSILKTLATAGAIVLSTLLGHLFLNGPLDLIIGIGGCCTIIAIFNYTMDNSTMSTPISKDNGAGKGSPEAKA
eukprot:gene11788-24702_t